MKAHNVRFRGHYTVPYAQRAKRGFCGESMIQAKLPVAAARVSGLALARCPQKGQPPGTKVQEAVLRDTPVRAPAVLARARVSRRLDRGRRSFLSGLLLSEQMLERARRQTKEAYRLN